MSAPETIHRTRRESFGAVVLSERPGFLAFVDDAMADRLGVARREDLPREHLSAPLDAHLALTARCDLRCDGCYAAPGGGESDLPTERATAIVDRLADLGVFTLSLGGGEPLLHPGVFEIAAHARRRGVLPQITTNGERIDARTARRLAVFGSVHVSWHGPGDDARVERAIRRLREAGIAPGLNVLLTRGFPEFLPGVFARAARAGIRRLLLLRYKVTAANRDRAGLAPTREEESALYPLVRRLARRRRILPMIDCSLFPAVAAHGVSPRRLRFFDVNGCRGGDHYLAVDSRGLARPCSFWPEDLGPAEALTARTWRDHPVLRRFRAVPERAACGACRHADLCHGGCRLPVAAPACG